MISYITAEEQPRITREVNQMQCIRENGGTKVHHVRR